MLHIIRFALLGKGSQIFRQSSTHVITLAQLWSLCYTREELIPPEPARRPRKSAYNSKTRQRAFEL
jgi:hypothetical protein